MTNDEKFQKVFGFYATEMWAKPEKEFLEWINSEALEYEPGEDLISRADAVKRLLLFKQSRAKSVSRYDIGLEDGLSHAINILDLVPLVYIPSINIEEEPKTEEWIPCSERLPEEFSVLCCDDYGGMLIAKPFECNASDTGFSAVNDGYYMYNCIAWMPLPMSYREGREDYELATEQMEHDIMYEPTYNSEDGSM